MPRAHRYFIPGHVWHITLRCHKKEFLLKLLDTGTPILIGCSKPASASVLYFSTTWSHPITSICWFRIPGADVISQSIQLVAGRTAQEYNLRKARKGPFWEDRYHATAIQTDHHRHRCIVYIELNMVRAGVVSHPKQ